MFFCLDTKERKSQGFKSLAKNEIRYAMEIKLVPICCLEQNWKNRNFEQKFPLNASLIHSLNAKYLRPLKKKMQKNEKQEQYCFINKNNKKRRNEGMKTIIKNIVKVIGLGTLVGYVWEIVYEELSKLAKESEATWDDKALEVIDKIVDTIIATLNGDGVKG